MNISNDILILKLVAVGGSLYSLRKRNLTHAQIAMLIQEQIDLGFLEMNNDELKVTDSGYEYLNEEIKKLNGNERAWILPQENYYRKPISPNKIILPKKI